MKETVVVAGMAVLATCAAGCPRSEVGTADSVGLPENAVADVPSEMTQWEIAPRDVEPQECTGPGPGAQLVLTNGGDTPVYLNLE